MSIFEQTVLLVSDLPGNLVYHLVVLAWLMTTMAGALNVAQHQRSMGASRLVFTVASLFTLQFLYFLVVILGTITLLNNTLMIPPLDRAVMALSIVLVIWNVAFPDFSRAADAGLALAILLIFIALGVTIVQWSAEINGGLQFFNNTPLETFWEGLKTILLIVGGVVIVARHRPGWVNGLLVIALWLGGHLIHLYVFPVGNASVSGVERLIDFVAWPLFGVYVYRQSQRGGQALPAPAPAPIEVVVTSAPSAPLSTTPIKAAVGFASLNAVDSPEESGQIIPLATTQAFNARACLLLDPPDQPSGPRLTGGYDAEGETFISSQLFILSETPEVLAAMQRRTPSELFPDAHPTDFRRLARVLGHAPRTPLWVVPLVGDNTPHFGALLVFGSTYPWSTETQNLLTALSEALVATLAGLRQSATAPVEATPEAANLQAIITTLQTQNDQASAESREAQKLAQRLRTDLSVAEAELEKLRVATSKAAEQIKTYQQTEAAQYDLLAEVHTLREQAAASSAHLLEQRLGNSNGGVAPADELVLARQEEIETYRQHERELRAELKQLRAQWEAATPAAHSLIDQLRAAETTSTPDPHHELAETRAELAEMANALAQLREHERKAKQEVGGAGQALARSQEQEAFLRQRWDEARTQLAQTQEAQAQLQTEVDRLQAELAAGPGSSIPTAAPELQLQLQLTIDELRADLNKAISQRMAQAVQLNDKARMLASLQAELFERTTELDTLREQHLQETASLQKTFAETRPSAAPTVEDEVALATPLVGKNLEVIHSLTQDLRQPMASISGYSDLLLGESVGILGALQRKFIERIKASTERMGSLLDDLIQLTALDTGQLAFAPEDVEVAHIITEAVKTCAAQFQERGVELLPDFSAQIPPIQADRDALRLIISNLLTNAVAASPAGQTVTLTARVEDEQTNRLSEAVKYLFISVRDAGGGIAVADQPRVFSRLYRADAPLIAGLGDTGVGLAMVKALVEAHHGRVWLTSDLGMGSTFSVMLPYMTVPAPLHASG